MRDRPPEHAEAGLVAHPLSALGRGATPACGASLLVARRVREEFVVVRGEHHRAVAAGLDHEIQVTGPRWMRRRLDRRQPGAVDWGGRQSLMQPRVVWRWCC